MMTLRINEILVEDRMRRDMGDIEELCKSILENGLIQPIVLAPAGNGTFRLVAGGRRYAALQRLIATQRLPANFTLIRGTHYVIRDEHFTNDAERLKLLAVELEENLKRKNLTWQEEVLGKRRLLETMQAIHGEPRAGSPVGFSSNKLASMLGQAPSRVFEDLQVAEAITKVPQLAKLENKSAVQTKLRLLNNVAAMHLASIAAQAAQKQVSEAAVAAGTTPPPQPKSWTLYEGDFRANAAVVPTESVDLVLTDLPYGADVHDAHGTAEHYGTFSDSHDATVRLLEDIAAQSYRVLRDARFAFFFFGFNYYTELVAALRNVGFHVDAVPGVWRKPTKFSPNPSALYCRSYEPILIARKGNATFVRSGQANVWDFAPPQRQDKLHLVEKPVGLLKQFIIDTTIEGAVVVDWCAGTGSTGVAAHELKRTSVLFETEPAMLAIAQARLGALK